MGPLICWDIIAESLHRRIALRDDLKILDKVARNNNWHFTETSWCDSFIWENKVIVVTDTLINIIHATENMFAMNGYTLPEIVGKNPRMFQGERTA